MATKGKGKGKGGKAGADDLNAIDEKEMYAAKVWTLQSKLGIVDPLLSYRTRTSAWCYEV